jgi:hypothetical protein
MVILVPLVLQHLKMDLQVVLELLILLRLQYLETF